MRHVPHIYVPQPWGGSTLDIDEGVRRHLRTVLHIDPGASVTYTDGRGRRGRGTLTSGGIGREEEVCEPPAASRITIATAPPRQTDRARFLVEKLAELGVARLVWLRTRFGVPRVPKSTKTAAWAISALEQSRGTWLMEIDETFPTASELTGTLYRADPGGGAIPAVHGDVTLLIGPEGGFSPDEIPSSEAISLGETILRVETAAIVGAALLKHAFTERGDNGGLRR